MCAEASPWLIDRHRSSWCVSRQNATRIRPMSIMPNHALNRMREGGLALGFGVGHLRTTATPMLAQAADFDFLFIDMEHGAFSIHEATQLCIASLMTRVTPIVRICKDALDEGTRA